MPQGQGHYVHLYDARNYGAGAFAELKVSQQDLEKAIQGHTTTDMNRAAALSRGYFQTLSFNTSGSSILVGADQGMTVVLDGFEGTIQRVFVGSPSSTRPAVSCFTTDDRTILCGNDDGSILCWDFATGALSKKLTGHFGPVTAIASNPKYAQFASACSQTALWLF
jgi:WD40 repeat protein